MIDLGDVVTRTVTVTDAVTQALVDPTTVTCTIILPDGSTTPATVIRKSQGLYQFSYTPTVTGMHRFNWQGVGNGADFGQPGLFRVWPALSVIDLDDARRLLNITETVDDEEIRTFIERATSAIATWCGPLVPTAVTSRVRSYSGGYPARAAYDGAQGYASSLVLPITPVISLTSITPLGGDPIDLTGVFVSPAGVVDASIAQLYTGRFYDVAYVAGRTTLPPDLYGAVEEMLRHLWATQRGGGVRPNSPAQIASQNIAGSAYSYPIRVEQLMQPYVQIGVG
jgi:hypothetical protein